MVRLINSHVACCVIEREIYEVAHLLLLIAKVMKILLLMIGVPYGIPEHEILLSCSDGDLISTSNPVVL